MAIDFVNTIYFWLLLAACVIVLALCLIRAILGVIRLQKYKKKKREENKLFWTVYFMVILFICIPCMIHAKEQYTERYKFDETLSENQNKRADNFNMFEELKRTKTVEAENYYSQIHMEWYKVNFLSDESKIVKDTFEQYKKNVKDIFSRVPYAEACYDREVEDIMDNYNIISDTFKNIVNKNHSSLDSSELWKGYEAGKKVQKVNFSSEVVFQTAVMAEDAHANAFKKNTNENSLTYAGGAVSEYELFLTFNNRDGGNGDVEDREICFRIGKVMLREAGSNKASKDSEKKHTGLFAYGCFNYAVENTDIMDELYLTYLYYEGCSLLNLTSYMDESLCKELCGEELEKWEQFDAMRNQGVTIRVENKSEEDIYYVRDKLKAQTK